MDNSNLPKNAALEAQRRLARLLLEDGFLSAGQVEDAVAAGRESGEHVLLRLVSEGNLSKGELHDFLSRQPGVAAIDLKQYVIERDLVTLIPADLARKRLVLPIDALGKLLTVAMACPLDTSTIEEVQAITGRRVKAVLCKWDDLLAVVQRFHPEGEEAQRTAELPEVSFESLNLRTAAPGHGGPTKQRATAAGSISEQLRQIHVLPVIRTVSDRIQVVAHAGASKDGDSPATIAAVCDLVAQDPGLASAVLHAANSEAYGLRGQVGSVALACTLLGAEAVAAVAAGLDASALEDSPALREARLCAIAAEDVARAAGQTETGFAFTAGLLHNLGRAALAQLDPSIYAGSGAADGHPALLEAEQAQFGMTFAEAGYEILDAWGLPTRMTRAIRDQLAPEASEAHRELAGIIACARALAVSCLAKDPRLPATDSMRRILQVVGINAALAESILTELARNAPAA